MYNYDIETTAVFHPCMFFYQDTKTPFYMKKKNKSNKTKLQEKWIIRDEPTDTNTSDVTAMKKTFQVNSFSFMFLPGKQTSMKELSDFEWD